MIRFRFLILLFTASLSQAADVIEYEFDLSNDLSINIRHYQSESKILLLWLPSERGIPANSNELATNLAELGLNLWIADLHSSYMVPVARNSMNQFPANDIVELLLLAKKQGFSDVYILTANKGTGLALKAIFEFSMRFPDSKLIKGSIFIHPNLFSSLPALGNKAAFIEGSNLSHLPVYMIQAQYSTKYVYTQEIRAELESGGSRVFSHLLADVEAGFYARPIHELGEKSIEARNRLPNIIKNATQLMVQIPAARLSIPQTNLKPKVKSAIAAKQSTLSIYLGKESTPQLRLLDIENKRIDLNDFRGRVVLLNFWASWCAPCVKEIPSLARLGSKLQHQPFDIVTVNIGESKNRVQRFLKPFNVKFPVLLDETGQAVRDWRVYAYPSNFLIDQQGRIRYVYSGALEWDSAEVTNLIKSLF